MNYVYILASQKNGTLYIGVTSNLIQRIYQHKNGKADGFTKKYGVNLLVYYEGVEDINSAIMREKRFKAWKRQWKIDLIEKNNHKGGNLLNALDVKQDALHPPVDIKEDSAKAITGHIDFVQLKFGSIYVLDYKPNASKVDAVSQLFVYAVALSVRTGVWLRNFRCAWFDEKGYYEFAPSDIVLKFCKFPQNRFREFFVRNKERRYFTSREFHEKMLNEIKVDKNAH